jgi:hypothetical protein
MPQKFFVGDIVQMKKLHPCGSDQWEVLRTGMDFRIRCLRCKHTVMITRIKFEKGIKKVINRSIEDDKSTQDDSGT